MFGHRIVGFYRLVGSPQFLSLLAANAGFSRNEEVQQYVPPS